MIKLTAEQTDIFRGALSFLKARSPVRPYMIINGLAGTGKAQPMDAMVLTPDGGKRMGDLRVGDAVIAGDGTPTKVIAIHEQGIKPIVRLHFSDNAWAECCEDHLWQLQDMHGRTRVLKAADIYFDRNRSKAWPFRLQNVGCVQFNAQPVPLDPYIYGQILGNGHLIPDKGSCIIATGANDGLETQARIKAAIPSATMAVREDGVHTSYIPADFTRWIQRAKSAQKYIDYRYLYNSVEVRKAVLAGLLDTDGTCRPCDGTRCKVEFSSTSRYLAYGVKELVLSLGGCASERSCDRDGYTEWTVSIQLPFNPFIVRRKATAWRPPQVIMSRKVIDRTAAGTAECRCITIEHPSQLYVTNSYLPTHNSTLLAQLAHEVPHALVCAFTGKAASVLTRKIGVPARTIHSAIYQFLGLSREVDPATGKRAPLFGQKITTGEWARNIVLVDECSMIPPKLARDLLATGARVVAFGDPGQLPPVRDRQFFQGADATLQHIHRQAWGSPIIRQAHEVRQGRAYQPDGRDFQVIDTARDWRQNVTQSIALGADMVLCWRNKTRCQLNNILRQYRGIDYTQRPFSGEPVMCLRNNHDLAFLNGAIYPVIEGGPSHLVLENERGQTIRVKSAIEGFDPDPDPEDQDTVHFAFAYAATVHKAQGSEWDRVLLVDEYNSYQERERWIYTGLTRAAKSIIVQDTAGYNLGSV